MAFPAIAKRTVVLVNHDTGERENFTVAISAPYRPAKTPGMEDHAACLLQVYEEIEDAGSEVFGADELEAMDNAINNAKLIFEQLVANGNVETIDGKSFSVKSTSMYTRGWQFLSERARRKLDRKGRG